MVLIANNVTNKCDRVRCLLVSNRNGYEYSEESYVNNRNYFILVWIYSGNSCWLWVDHSFFMV